MKKLILCIMFFSIFSFVTSKKIDANYRQVRLEMTLISGEVVSESYIVSRNDSIFIRANKNKSWLVSISNSCDDCIPTIIKNNKVAVRNMKATTKQSKAIVTGNLELIKSYLEKQHYTSKEFPKQFNKLYYSKE